MKKTKSFRFSFFSVMCVCIMSVLTIMYIFSISLDSITGGKAGEIFAVWPYDIGNDLNKKQQKIEKIIEDIDDWAEEKQATILLKPLDGLGVAIVDYSGWLKENYGISYAGEKKTVLIKEGTTFAESFVEGNVLFLDTYGYHVVGTYGDNTKENEVLFYFPLCDYQSGEWDLGCLMYIYAEDSRISSEFVQALQEMGITISYINQSDKTTGIWNTFLQILKENRDVRCMLISLIGVWFCVILAVSLFYRCTKKNLRILHLYGATYTVLFREIGLGYEAAALIGVAGGFLLGCKIFDISDIGGVMKLSIGGSILTLLIVFLIHVISYMTWYLRYEKKGGRY